jgi:hypothetical protein
MICGMSAAAGSGLVVSGSADARRGCVMARFRAAVIAVGAVGVCWSSLVRVGRVR